MSNFNTQFFTKEGKMKDVLQQMEKHLILLMLRSSLPIKENGKTPRRQSSFGRMLTKGLKILRSKLGMNSTNCLILKEMIKGLPETTQGEPI